MNEIEHFTEFVNGRLDADTEQGFFGLLASDAAMRADFRTFVAVFGSIKNNRKAFVPSPELTGSVFAAAGISISGLTGLSATSAAKNGFLLSKTFTAITSSIITLIISFSAAYFLFKTENNNGNAGAMVNSSISGNVPVVSSLACFDSISNINQTEKAQKTVIKYVYIDNSVNKHSEPDNSNLSDKPVRQNKGIVSGRVNAIGRFEIKPAALGRIPDFGTVLPVSGLNYGKEESTNFYAEISNNPSWSIPGAKISPEEYSPFNNISAAIYYNIDEKFKAGIEVSQETFYTEYTGSDPDGSKYRIKQQPNLTTASANIRYSPLGRTDISPFFQVGAGANKGGYVLKPSIGLEYAAYPGLSFILGAEYNRFWFFHGMDKNWFNTGKFDLKYGIIFKF